MPNNTVYNGDSTTFGDGSGTCHIHDKAIATAYNNKHAVSVYVASHAESVYVDSYSVSVYARCARMCVHWAVATLSTKTTQAQQRWNVKIIKIVHNVIYSCPFFSLSVLTEMYAALIMDTRATYGMVR